MVTTGISDLDKAFVNCLFGVVIVSLHCDSW